MTALALSALLCLAAAIALLIGRMARLSRAAFLVLVSGLGLAVLGYGLAAASYTPESLARSASASDPGTPALDKGDEQGWLHAGQNELLAGRARSAVATFSAATRAWPQSASLWAGLGGALTVQAEGLVPPAARLAFARARALDPAMVQPYFFDGVYFAQQGRFDQARAAWRQALARSPEAGPVREQILENLAALTPASAPGPAVTIAQPQETP